MNRFWLAALAMLPMVANADISFVAYSEDSDTATSVTPGEPTGTAEDDLVLAFCTKAETDGAWTDPADFTQIDQVQYLATGLSYIGYKVRGSTAGSGYAFSHSGASQMTRCTLTVFRGIDTGTPFDVTYSQGSHYNDDLDELIAAQPITTVTDDAWVVLFYHEQSDTSFTAVAPSNYTIVVDEQGGAGSAQVVAYREIPSAGVVTPGAWQHTSLATSASALNFTIALKPETTVLPTLTAGPAAGTITSTTIPVTFTSDTTGTVKGTACLDGQAGDATETLAGQCSGGGAAEATISEGVTATVGDGATFSSLDPSTRYDLSFVIDATPDSALYSLADQDTSAAPGIEFTANPSCSATTNGVSCTYTSNTSSTNYGVCVNPGDGTPSAAQIKAGDNDAGTDALWAGSDANTLNISDTITVTGSNTPVRMDCHFVLSNGSSDGPVYSGQTDENRSARSGFAIVVMASHSSTGVCNLDNYFAPDCADGDVFEYEDDTNENADCNVSVETDGDIVLTPVTTGDCDGRQSFEISYQDVSSTESGLFTSPNGIGDFSTDDTIYINNTAPVCEGPDEVVVLVEDSAMSTINMDELGECSDADGDQLSAEIFSGSLPVGTALGSTGNLAWTGTPTTENTLGEVVTVEICDIADDCTTFDFTVYVNKLWTMPDCNNLTASECEEAVISAAPWRESNADISVGDYVCGTGQSFLHVGDQDPDAGETPGPFDPITINLVGALIPDLTGMTLAEAIAAIEAICP